MKKTMWALFDNRMGSVGQARGIIQALGDKIEVIEKQIAYTPLAKLPNCLKGRSLLGIDKSASAALEAPWPEMVLSISRRTTPVARWIQKQSGGKSKIIQLMHPGNCGLKDLELVIVSEHDAGKSKGSNFMFICGCPHRVSAAAVAEARQKWTPVFAELPRPWISVIVGGAIKGRPFSLENARALGKEIKNIQQKLGGSILITTSRRTGSEAEAAIMQELKGIPAYTFLWGEKKENPIMGFFACGDKIIATGDSVSMVCESCGSGNPVLIFRGKDWLSAKHHRFVQSLFDKGYAIALEDPAAADFKPCGRLDPAEQIAARILEIG